MEDLKERLTLKFKDFILQEGFHFSWQMDPDLPIEVFVQQKIDAVIPSLELLLQEGCPAYIAEEIYLDELYEQLRPSEIPLLASVMEKEFPQVQKDWLDKSIYEFEMANLSLVCRPLWEHQLISSKTLESTNIYSRLTGIIYRYLTETSQLATKQF